MLWSTFLVYLHYCNDLKECLPAYLCLIFICSITHGLRTNVLVKTYQSNQNRSPAGIYGSEQKQSICMLYSRFQACTLTMVLRVFDVLRHVIGQTPPTL